MALLPISWILCPLISASLTQAALRAWCSSQSLSKSWQFERCNGSVDLSVRVLTYNLFWWNLFGVRKGNQGSAGKLIAAADSQEIIDIIGFQECDDAKLVLSDAGLSHQFSTIEGRWALVTAYKHDAWKILKFGEAEVAEDQKKQYYGRRGALWTRFQSRRNGRVVFFVNHHGPLPRDTGGLCGPESTAYNLLQLIASNSVPGDTLILVGDFNANSSSRTFTTLDDFLQNVFTGTSFGGVDHIFTNCKNYSAEVLNLGAGGSDHDALSAKFQFGKELFWTSQSIRSSVNFHCLSIFSCFCLLSLLAL
eukprot:TRINITY_DN65117_c0_g1_i1.p1 TRINITY_DN65117_c0_g1~~TRINITY_DN65117_c0_g1_i1.p1  ORF type:complete len:307 (-),score=21.68 TRINITY_DN65117_c0_g1_i1:109-1029(-)